MLILVEGVDGVGKTTLAADVLEGFYGLPGPGRRASLKFSVPERHPLMDYELSVDWYRPGRGDHLVIDRGHLSDLVYGPRYRGRSELGPEGELHVDAYLQSRGCLVVYVYDSPSAIRRRMAETREEGEGYATSTDDLGDLLVDFRPVLDRSALPVLEYPFAGADVDEVLSCAAEYETAAAPLAPYPTYVGPTCPEVLFLGEERPAGRRASEHAASFAPYPDCSGRYLLRVLGSLTPGFRQTCGLANALELPGQIGDLVEALGGPRVVALGKEAHAECDRQGVDHGTVPHPQYHRRFHHHRPRLYHEAIQAALAGRHTTSYPIPPAGEGWEAPLAESQPLP